MGKVQLCDFVLLIEIVQIFSHIIKEDKRTEENQLVECKILMTTRVNKVALIEVFLICTSSLLLCCRGRAFVMLIILLSLPRTILLLSK